MKKKYEKVTLRIMTYQTDILTDSVTADQETVIEFNPGWLN